MLHMDKAIDANRKRGRIDLVPTGVGELKTFSDAFFERFCHRLVACFVHQPIEVECWHKAVLTIWDNVAVLIELCIDDGDVLGMVTLFNEEDRVVFSDVTYIVHRLASHRRTSERVVKIYHLHQNKRYY